MGNVITIKLRDLWKYPIGTRVLIPEVCSGWYVGRSLMDGIEAIWSEDTDTMYYCEDINDDTEVIVSKDNIDIDKLISIMTKEILNLIEDGWSDSNDKYLNLSPYISKLKEVVQLKGILYE